MAIAGGKRGQTAPRGPAPRTTLAGVFQVGVEVATPANNNNNHNSNSNNSSHSHSSSKSYRSNDMCCSTRTVCVAVGVKGESGLVVVSVVAWFPGYRASRAAVCSAGVGAVGSMGRSGRAVRRRRPEVAPAAAAGPRRPVPATNEPEVAVAVSRENECPGSRTTGTRACGSTRVPKRPTVTIVIVRTSEEEDAERAEEDEDNESTVRKSKL